MTYQEALALVKSEYDTLYDSKHNEIIRTGLTYDGCNGFCVSLYDEGERVILTDLGETKEIFDEVTEEEWSTLCEQAGFTFNHWHIEHDFTSLDDVEIFIAFLNFIADIYCPIDD